MPNPTNAVSVQNRWKEPGGARKQSGQWSLEPESAQWADGIRALMPQPLHQLGVQGARSLPFITDAIPLPVSEIVDLEVPTASNRMRVRAYRPSLESNLPLVIYLHGGGWVFGGLEQSDRLCRGLSSESNCVVISVDYPLAPENPFPAAIEEIYELLMWVGSAPEALSGLGADTTQLAVIGDSAGGNLAAALTIMTRDRGGPQLISQVLVYPATRRDSRGLSEARWTASPLLTSEDLDWFWDLYEAPVEAADSRAHPGTADLRDLPAALVILAEIDPLFEDGLAYANRLKSAGVEVQAVTYGGTFHGFFPRSDISPSAANAVKEAASHIRASFDKIATADVDK